MTEQVQDTAQQTPPTSETFEGWLASQDDTVKNLYTAHTSGLKSALENERQASKAAQAQLRDLAKKAERGSEAEKALLEQADKLASLERQSGFYDRAHAAGVRNLKLAYMAAQQADLINSRGECDFAKLRTEYPELFLSPPGGNAGSGTGSQPPKAPTMDQLIRGAIGR